MIRNAIGSRNCIAQLKFARRRTMGCRRQRNRYLFVGTEGIAPATMDPLALWGDEIIRNTKYGWLLCRSLLSGTGNHLLVSKTKIEGHHSLGSRTCVQVHALMFVFTANEIFWCFWWIKGCVKGPVVGFDVWEVGPSDAADLLAWTTPFLAVIQKELSEWLCNMLFFVYHSTLPLIFNYGIYSMHLPARNDDGGDKKAFLYWRQYWLVVSLLARGRHLKVATF